MLGSFEEICERAIVDNLPVFYHKPLYNEKNCIAVYIPDSSGYDYYFYCAIEDWKAKMLLRKFKEAGVKTKFGRPVFCEK